MMLSNIVDCITSGGHGVKIFYFASRTLFNVQSDLLRGIFIAAPERVFFHSSPPPHARKKLPFEYVRPPRISYPLYRSGDKEQMKKPNLQDIRLEFKECEELKNADDITKTLLSLEFLPKRFAARQIKWHYIRKVRKHDIDVGSTEVGIAALTIQLRNIQEHVKLHSHDKVNNSLLTEMVDRRNKLLRRLRAQDYQRFEWIMKELNVVHKPTPRYHYRVTRKGGIRELTQKYCDDIRIEKLRKLRDTFKAQQEDFVKEKEERLRFIAEEEKFLGLVSKTKLSDMYHSNAQPPPVASTLKQIARTSEGTQDSVVVGPPPEY